MVVSSVHWLVAAAIAVAIHLAGVLWLNFATPQPRPERMGEGIVVTLGRASGIATQDAKGLSSPQAAPQSPESQAETEPPDSATTARQPAVSKAEPADNPTPAEKPGPVEPESPDSVEPAQATAVDALSPTAPQPVKAPTEESRALTGTGSEATAAVTAQVDTSKPADPLSVEAVTEESRALAQGGSEAPEIVAARVVETSRPAEPLSVEAVTVESRTLAEAGSEASATAAAQAVDLSKPAVSQTPAVQQARPKPPKEASAETPGAPVTARAAGTPKKTIAAPRESADSAAVPDVSVATTAEQEARSVDLAFAAPEPAVEAAGTAPPAAAAAAGVETVEPSRGGSIEQPESVQPAPAEPASSAKVTAARQPAPEAQKAAAPQISEPAEPRTVDLEKVRESSDGTGVVARYAGVLKGWLQKNMHYPRAARLAGHEGRVVVRFVIARDGKVRSVKLESGSGFPLLDREAKEMIERGDPFPAMPPEMAGQELEVRVPVSFHVRDETVTKEIPPIDLQ